MCRAEVRWGQCLKTETLSCISQRLPGFPKENNLILVGKRISEPSFENLPLSLSLHSWICLFSLSTSFPPPPSSLALLSVYLVSNKEKHLHTQEYLYSTDWSWIDKIVLKCQLKGKVIRIAKLRSINKEASFCANSIDALQLAYDQDGGLKQFSGERFQQRSLAQVAISQQRKDGQSFLLMPRPTPSVKCRRL